MNIIYLIVTCLSLQFLSGEAAFSGAVYFPCINSMGDLSWELTLKQTIRISDVVMLGQVVELQEGIRGTLNATIASMITYKGRFSQNMFLSRVEDVTNFAKDTPLEEMALLFFALEPAGNLALRCMSPLLTLSTHQDLKIVLDFVRDFGRESNKENEIFVPPSPDPCTVSPSPCNTGSFCTVINTLPGQPFKCTCLTGYTPNGDICEIIGPTETPEPTPVEPDICGGMSSPLLDLLGNAERCNERNYPGYEECPPMYYCHHGICCPVTPPNTPITLPSPSPPSPPLPSLTPITTTITSPSVPHPPPDIVDCGSGGSGDMGSGGCEEISGSGELGSGDDIGSGEGVKAGEIQSERYTFSDDEDMAFGQIKRRRR